MNNVYLAHHGIKGMHWGIRRFQPYGIGYDRKGGKTGKEIKQARKEAKKAARQAEKALNKSARTELKLTGIEYRLESARRWNQKHPEVLDKKISEIRKEREKARDETIELLKKVNKDSNLVWKTTLVSTTAYDLKKEAEMNKKYGFTLQPEGGRKSVMGTGYKVRAKDSFSGRHKSYSDDRYKQGRNTTIATTYYY